MGILQVDRIQESIKLSAKLRKPVYSKQVFLGGIHLEEGSKEFRS